LGLSTANAARSFVRIRQMMIGDDDVESIRAPNATAHAQ
jgi:hypothetical protein